MTGEPSRNPVRITIMQITTPRSRTLAALLTASIAFTACGSDATTVAGGGDDDPAVTVPVADDGATGDTGVAGPDDSNDVNEPGEPPVDIDGTVLGTANVGGEIVDPVRHQIDDLLILESYPEQLSITFTAGAEPCLAATATAIADDAQILVTLDVGITTDALTKSCEAGEFTHTLNIALSEGIDGREIVLAAAGERPVADEPEPQAFETTLIGLSEQSAEEAAAQFGYDWRVVHRDGEDYAVTMDLNENRINATIVDGVVTEATLG